MVVDRRKEIENFRKEVYYKVHIEKDDLKLSLKDNFDKNTALNLSNKCNGKNAVITSVESVEKLNKPPKLYDLTTLQGGQSHEK